MQTAKRKRGPRHLVWWINGNWPGPYMQGLLPQSICLAANKTARTIEEIAKMIDANPEFVREAIDPLVREELVTKADDRYLANFIALDADDWISITKDVRAHAKVLADRLETHLPALEAAWAKSTLPKRGFSWQEGIWPMLAMFVCNQGVSRNSAAPPVPEAPVHGDSGNRYCAGGREVVPPEYVLGCVGFNNWSPTPDAFCYGYFWSYVLERVRLHTPEPNAAAAVFEALDAGLSDPKSIAEAACRPLEQVEERLAKLVEAGVVRREDGRLSLTFPVIRKEDSDVLTPTVDGVCSELSSEILAPATADVSERLRASGYGHLEDQFPEWRRWFEGNICGEALRELLSRSILPDPGSPAPAGFCLVGWRGEMRLMSRRP